jgi:hypothetical protein
VEVRRALPCRDPIAYDPPVTVISNLRLPIAWDSLAWPTSPRLGTDRGSTVTLATGDPAWGWEPAAPAFPVGVITDNGGEDLSDFTVDHVVLLVPDLDAAVGTLARIDLTPRLRMRIRGDRRAAFFRVGPVLEVVEAPVRGASLYGVALATTHSLESVSLSWKALGLDVGDIGPAMQPGRRIMTIRGLDAGLAVMSADGPARVA